MNSGKMPTALQSIQRYVVVGMLIVGFVTFGIGGWAATSQLSGAVIGQGVVVVDSNVKKVQHATGGIVGELRVREGDHVNAGDILIRLDETQTLANATIVTQSVDELRARQTRLENPSEIMWISSFSRRHCWNERVIAIPKRQERLPQSVPFLIYASRPGPDKRRN